jgi:iron complex transport system ATP-binding protein
MAGDEKHRRTAVKGKYFMNINNIQIKNLTWAPSRSRAAVLNDVSVTFEKGKFYGILGPNGAGKTSLIRQILGLVKADSGNVFLDGKSIKDFSRTEFSLAISFLPQAYHRDVDFTVYEVVSMGREPYLGYLQSPGESDRRLIDDALEYVRCSEFKDKKITTLSGGELQRVMLARCFTQDTPWIILDEPVSSLDVKHQLELMSMLENLCKEKGKTIIAILHDINLAAQFCSDIIFMKNGGIKYTGQAADVLTPDILREVYETEFEFITRADRQEAYIVPIAPRY